MEALIVDDVEENITLLAMILEDLYDLRIATSGREALSLIAAKKPDIILLDIMMPGIDGYQVCEVLKQDENTRNIPIIFLTAKSDKSSVIKGLKLGADDYLIKPYDKEEVRSRIQKVLKATIPPPIGSSESLFDEIRLYNYQICQMAAFREQNENYKRLMSDIQELSSKLSFYVQYVDIIEELLSKKMIMISKDYKNNKSTLDRLYKLQEARFEKTAVSDSEIAKQIKDLMSGNHFLKTCNQEMNSYEEELLLIPYLSFIFEEKKLHVDLKTNDEGLSLGCNKVILKQVMLTLLDNVMIHDEDSEVPIPMTIDRTSDRIIVSVRNRTTGIDTSVKEDLFAQGVSSCKRTGMGLSAARYLAHNYLRGDVTLTGNEPAEFSLILPN